MKFMFPKKAYQASLVQLFIKVNYFLYSKIVIVYLIMPSNLIQQNLETIMPKKQQQNQMALSQLGLKKITTNFGIMQDSVDKDRYQNDLKFSEAVQLLNDRTKMLEKHVFANRPQLTEQEYEMIQKIGQMHYKCQIANQSSPLDLDKQKWPQDQRCKCGCNKGSGQNIPICTQIQKYPFFGDGVILFFYYCRKVIYLLISILVIYGVFALVTNIVNADFTLDCTKEGGGLPFMCQVIRNASLKNKIKQRALVMTQLWLAVPMCIIWAIGIRLIRNFGRRLNQQIDQKLDSSSDYCIWIEDLPAGKYDQNDIIVFLNKLWKNRENKKYSDKLVIKSVQIIYLLDEVGQAIRQIRKQGINILNFYEDKPQQEQQQKKEVQNQQNDDKILLNKPKKETQKRYRIKQGKVDQYIEAKKRLSSLEQQFKLFRKKFLQDSKFRKTKAHQAALVQFFQNRQQNQFLDNYGRFQQSKFKEIKHKITSFFVEEEQSFTFKGQIPRIILPSEPSDINWHNAAENQSYGRILAVWLINIFLIGCSFGCLMLFRYLTQTFQALASALFVKIVILNLFNRIIWNILLMVVDIEKNKTKTESMASVMHKSYLAQSANVIILPIIVNLVFGDKLFEPSGLAGAVHDYQLTVFIFMIFFNVINVPHRITQLIVCIPCLRRIFIKYYCRVIDKLTTYEQLKDVLTFLYQPPKLPLVGLYVYITSTINQAFFFCYIQPIILFYLFGNLVIFYFINRLLILRVTKIPDMINYFIFETVIIMAMNVPAFYAIGSIVLLYQQGQTDIVYYIPSIICFIIWFLGSQNPFSVTSRFVTWLENLYVDHQEANNEENKKPSEEAKSGAGDKNIEKTGILSNKTFKPKRTLDSNISTKPKEESSNINLIEAPSQQNLAEIQEDKKSSDDSISVKTNVRRQNYYGANQMADLFNFQNKLSSSIGPYHGRLREYCQGFNFNMKRRKKKILVEDV